ncbi:hypothetical protein L7F22_023664 [Adiantum nelumboides]|nr:hypothetical protein [Adiantum nelumboides]
MGMERPPPLLGQQPALPGHNAVLVKFMHPEGIIDEQALVPITPYVELSPSTIWAKGEWFNPYPSPMEEPLYYAHSKPTPMYFVANQGVRPPMGRPMIKPKTENCHNCGTNDHWKNECPMPDKNLKPMEVFCTECGKKGGHFPEDCVKNLANKGKTVINVVEMIPNSSSKKEPIVRVKVITTAQAKKKKYNSYDESEGSKNSPYRTKKRRSQRYELRKQIQREVIEEKAKKLFQEKEKEKEGEIKETSTKSGGSILVYKIFEPINLVLEAFQAGLKAGQNMENKWKNYPSPDMEAAKLEAYQNLSFSVEMPLPVGADTLMHSQVVLDEDAYGTEVVDRNRLAHIVHVGVVSCVMTDTDIVHNGAMQIITRYLHQECQRGSSPSGAYVTFTLERYTWVSFLKLKSEVFGSIRDWKAMVEKEKDLKVQSIRSDRGGEFLSENFARWCKSEGIRRQLTTPYTPSQNGVVKRKNRTIMEMARAMLAHASLPRSY